MADLDLIDRDVLMKMPYRDLRRYLEGLLVDSIRRILKQYGESADESLEVEELIFSLPLECGEYEYSVSAYMLLYGENANIREKIDEFMRYIHGMEFRNIC